MPTLEEPPLFFFFFQRSLHFAGRHTEKPVAAGRSSEDSDWFELRVQA